LFGVTGSHVKVSAELRGAARLPSVDTVA
jgi:hypothetical protein